MLLQFELRKRRTKCELADAKETQLQSEIERRGRLLAESRARERDLRGTIERLEVDNEGLEKEIGCQRGRGGGMPKDEARGDLGEDRPVLTVARRLGVAGDSSAIPARRQRGWD